MQGIAGSVGPRGLIWRGTWSGATTYAIGDAVERGGSAYVGLAASTAVPPPSIEWELLASTGATGPQGPQGPAGPAGTVAFGTAAGTAAEGNDPRLSDARDPRPGSGSYVQIQPGSPQAGSLGLSGSGAFGGTVSAASFAGNGAALTSLSAAALTGQLAVSALPLTVPLLDGTGKLPSAYLPATLATRSYVDVSVAPLATKAEVTASVADLARKSDLDASVAPLARMSNSFAEQSGARLPVVGSAWTPVPGAQVSFTSATPITASLLASASVSGLGAGTFGTCGFRFEIDGAGYGDATWGDRLVQCGTEGGALPWWCAWAMQRVVSLPAGLHTIGVQATGLDSTSGCFVGGGSHANVKLSVSTS